LGSVAQGEYNAQKACIAGVDVGGLHAAQASQLLESRLRARLARRITLVFGSHRFTVEAAQARELTAALLSFTGPSMLTAPTRAAQPRLWTSMPTRRYCTCILVSRETFTLRLYKQLKLVKTYRIAVGMQGLETPAGEYTINDKQINPSWHVPLSAWAGDLADRIIPPGPADPIKARWMGFFVDRQRRVAWLHPDDDP
jgi:murein L,D-transpeptidase YcbB/YkuD